MEVIPLLLLTLEAWSFIKSGEQKTLERYHLHRWAVWFLVSVGVWNFLGAGVFGFLINLPVVSYYEIGTALTANHAHTAMMGVYGMLAAGLLLFCLRYLTRPDRWSDRAAKISFWSLNIGLAWMAFVNLFPLGIVQLYYAVDTGYWYARSLDFINLPWVNVLEWARLPGDALFIIGGALPLVWLCWQALTLSEPAPNCSRDRVAAHALYLRCGIREIAKPLNRQPCRSQPRKGWRGTTKARGDGFGKIVATVPFIIASPFCVALNDRTTDSFTMCKNAASGTPLQLCQNQGWRKHSSLFRQRTAVL